ncbi:hypothetical protein Tco_0611069 [Tanacetum coccineum]
MDTGAFNGYLIKANQHTFLSIIISKNISIKPKISSESPQTQGNNATVQEVVVQDDREQKMGNVYLVKAIITIYVLTTAKVFGYIAGECHNLCVIEKWSPFDDDVLKMINALLSL